MMENLVNNTITLLVSLSISIKGVFTAIMALHESLIWVNTGRCLTYIKVGMFLDWQKNLKAHDMKDNF